MSRLAVCFAVGSAESCRYQTEEVPYTGTCLPNPTVRCCPSSARPEEGRTTFVDWYPSEQKSLPHRGCWLHCRLMRTISLLSNPVATVYRYSMLLRAPHQYVHQKIVHHQRTTGLRKLCTQWKQHQTISKARQRTSLATCVYIHTYIQTLNILANLGISWFVISPILAFSMNSVSSVVVASDSSPSSALVTRYINDWLTDCC